MYAFLFFSEEDTGIFQEHNPPVLSTGIVFNALAARNFKVEAHGYKVIVPDANYVVSMAFASAFNLTQDTFSQS